MTNCTITVVLFRLQVFDRLVCLCSRNLKGDNRMVDGVD
jgi:hypothetical protein